MGFLPLPAPSKTGIQPWFVCALIHWQSAFLAQQAEMMSPSYKAKELWIALDCIHP